MSGEGTTTTTSSEPTRNHNPATTTLPRSVPTTSSESGEIGAGSSAATQDDGTEEVGTLEWAQVIELQAFSERKVWIEEKTRLLEQMPPIEVFVGLDTLRSSSETISSELPTRAELRAWVVEHDKIEKETEIFDAGEFRKLKKFTKAAAQRNLSPADTDLIELTLTTIYALDKLLHLLRGRSENLELLAVRLTWEEHRCAAWADYHKVMKDLGAFLKNRAQWSPSIYENIVGETPSSSVGRDTPVRRGSVASVASASSDTAAANMSRAARFKLAEVLSKDAAILSTRISSLRHGKISVAGKALDKLIDESRKPVPDIILDEQDRLENKGIAEMEDLGQFVMDVVMQWKKADEIYVENKKDQASALTLIEEIETALSSHPTSRQNTLFTSRANALSMRLSQRGDPAAVKNTFLHPTHMLFLEQDICNRLLVCTLSAEMVQSVDLTQKAEELVKTYHAAYETVERTEGLCSAAEQHLEQYETIAQKLENGVGASDDDDGKPPDLEDTTCLEPTTHATFLALFPRMTSDLDELNRRATRTLQELATISLRLSRPNIDPDFKANANAVADNLSSKKRSIGDIHADVSARVSHLKHIRRIRTSLDGVYTSLEDIRQDIDEGIRRDQWTPRSVNPSAPLTPESSLDPLPAAGTTPEETIQSLNDIRNVVVEESISSFASISANIPQTLRNWVEQDLSESKGAVDGLLHLASLWQASIKQSSVMFDVTDTANDLRVQLDDLQGELDAFIDAILDHNSTPSKNVQENLTSREQRLQNSVKTFMDNLSHRVPFIGSVKGTVKRPPPRGRSSRHRSSTSSVSSVASIRQRAQAEFPPELASLDNTVRADCNQLCITLSGAAASLQTRVKQLKVAELSRKVEAALAAIHDDIRTVADDINDRRDAFSSIKSPSLEYLDDFSTRLDADFQARRVEISRSFSPIRELFSALDALPGSREPGPYERMVLPRTRSMKEAETNFDVLQDRAAKLKALVLGERKQAAERLARAVEEETRRIEEERRAEEERLRKEEEERLAREEQECIRVAELARLRLEVEESTRKAERERHLLEVERMRAQEEEERLWREKEERLMKEEAERVRQEELERLRREEARLKAEEERLKAEEARLRKEGEGQQRVTEEQRRKEEELQRLEEERLRKVKEERSRRAEAERLRLEEEELRAKAVAERLKVEEGDRRRRAEEERAKADRLRAAAEEEERRRKGEEERLRMEEEGRLRALAELKREEERLRADIMRRQEEARLEEEARKRKISEEELAREEEERRRSKEMTIFELQRDGPSQMPESSPDVFGPGLAPAADIMSPARNGGDLKSRIYRLRKRLRTLNLKEIVHPSTTTATLPTKETYDRLSTELSGIDQETKALPPSVPGTATEIELRSLRDEVSTSSELLQSVLTLSELAYTISTCDAGLSDLLEHLDSFPSLPIAALASSHVSDPTLLPEEQLQARMDFTKKLVEDVEAKAGSVARDSRASGERERIQQAWGELEAMSEDIFNGVKSRPPSTISSGRNSRASLDSVHTGSSAGKKRNSYAQLSRGRDSSGFLAPLIPGGRRPSKTPEPRNRTSSRNSVSSIRSVSGPTDSRLHQPTFASRQRTTSITSNVGVGINPLSRSTASPRPRLRGGTVDSPTPGEVSSLSRSHLGQSTVARPSWARAPRQPLPFGHRPTTPRKSRAREPRKPYVANPKNRLDVAVGAVVNKLPVSVNINIEAVADTWKDKSGKYWIGDYDPKLCFCRILRSQTVMVRVGGGWQELSKFISGHFADVFRVLPDSPGFGSKEEKWISAASLRGPDDSDAGTPSLLKTPERNQGLPSFALSTPSGRSPQSIRSTPSNTGSPGLMPMQFMRRADYDPFSRPETPSKSPSRRPRGSTPNTPRQAWRP